MERARGDEARPPGSAGTLVPEESRRDGPMARRVSISGIAGSRSIACHVASENRCPYRSIVVAAECPRTTCTAFTSAPAAMSGMRRCAAGRGSSAPRLRPPGSRPSTAIAHGRWCSSRPHQLGWGRGSRPAPWSRLARAGTRPVPPARIRRTVATGSTSKAPSRCWRPTPGAGPALRARKRGSFAFGSRWPRSRKWRKRRRARSPVAGVERSAFEGDQSVVAGGRPLPVAIKPLGVVRSDGGEWLAVAGDELAGHA